MDNMDIYNAVRAVPQDAKKPIQAGRLKGKTDINPMWRIKELTERFGPCGFGWKYEIVRRETLPSPTGEVAAFVDINLYIKVDGEWSAPIPGTGGNSFVENERNGPHMSDDCFKMALTDALSVACKAIGVAADVYWESDKSKYDRPPAPHEPPPPPAQQTRRQEAAARAKAVGMAPLDVSALIKSSYNREKVDDLTPDEYADLLAIIDSQRKEAA